MTCASQCYVIGGPWIDYDPECPEHGDTARQMEAGQRRLDIDRDTRITSLERQVAQLIERLEALESAEYWKDVR